MATSSAALVAEKDPIRRRTPGKGKRGGLRVIYYWHEAGRQFWLFTVYDNDEADDLTVRQRELLRERLGMELNVRGEGR